MCCDSTSFHHLRQTRWYGRWRHSLPWAHWTNPVGEDKLIACVGRVDDRMWDLCKLAAMLIRYLTSMELSTGLRILLVRDWRFFLCRQRLGVCF